MSNAQEELESRISKAVAGCRLGSPGLHQQVRWTLNRAFADGLLTEPPCWISPAEVKVLLKPDVKKISVEVEIQFGGAATD